jgi:N-carbamoyl-L-amino-acid hydrolase
MGTIDPAAGALISKGTQPLALAVARAVDEERLWMRLQAMAAIGATPAGGVNRQALSTEDAQAQRQLVAWGEQIGLEPSADAAGNLFLRLPGRDPQAAPVMTGSHLDSQPTGGRFDGVYGVLAGLEALQALASAGVRPQRPIDLVAWMNEEGSRFAPGMMGSEAYAGLRALETLLPATDAQGVSVAQALAAMPAWPSRALGGSPHAYLEAHIEQGPLLERAGLPVGVVTGIQGKHTGEVCVRGEAAHAGTTPRDERRDALLSACALVGALDRAVREQAPEAMFTVGRFSVVPNAPSVIASEVRFTVDLRHFDGPLLAQLASTLAEVCRRHPGPCEVRWQERVAAAPVHFPAPVRELVASQARALAIDCMELPSAAGHDARPVSHVAPAGMIFVPCAGGISHNEAESAEPSDLAAGTRVLAACLVRLAC